jgi:hypothetical protein
MSRCVINRANSGRISEEEEYRRGNLRISGTSVVYNDLQLWIQAMALEMSCKSGMTPGDGSLGSL